MSVALHHGDCVEVMRGMAEASVDACVCDPPYGLEFMGRDWDAPWKSGAGGMSSCRFNEKRYKDGSTAKLPSFVGGTNPTCRNCGGLRSGRDTKKGQPPCRCDAPKFDNVTLPRMQAFQAWCEIWAAEALRVLKPGGHLIAFSGTRTYHRMACAIEDAGFEIRDQIGWLYGSGFPKSHDISKALDRAAGVEREVVGVHRRHGGGSPVSGSMSGPLGTASDLPLTAPATDAAKQWEGWGTALKPAWEPICLARKPLIGTVAANVAAHGTGALNIRACRVPTSQDGARNNPDDSRACTCPSPMASPILRSGRNGSPALSGGQLGDRNAPQSSESEYGRDDQRPLSSLDGYQTCPRCGGELARDPEGRGQALSQQQADARIARDLDGEGGHSRAGLSMACGDCTPQDIEKQSRWPANIAHDGSDEVLEAFAEQSARMGMHSAGHDRYQGKRGKYNASSYEIASDETTLFRYGDAGTAARFFYSAKATKAERGEGNSHPTVKPIALMRWLCRLVTPPGGTVLDPFAGSGSTLIAADREGFNAIGIEREAEYVEIARRRLADDAPLLAAAS